MKTPQISIILPFFNAEKTLFRALDSIAEQDLQDFECILVDNNSTDESRAIARNFCLNSHRFTLIEQSRRGVVYAHNAGMALSQGKYIARMDADDWMFPDRLKHQFKYLENNPEIDVVAGQAEYIPHIAQTDGFQRYVDWSNSITDNSDIFLKQFMESPVINPTAMWRRTVSDKFGSYRHGDFPEDYELWLRWLNNGVKIYKLPIPVIKWFDSAKRLTRTDLRYSDQAFFKIKTKYLARWLTKYNPHHPYVSVWGASRISRNRARILESNGIIIQSYIDITTKRQIEHDVMHYKDLPNAGKNFILVYLKQENMRTETVQFLNNKGYLEGTHYLLVS
jgi:glycosyltransferase involved in cell wall biosynthesis